MSTERLRSDISWQARTNHIICKKKLKKNKKNKFFIYICSATKDVLACLGISLVNFIPHTKTLLHSLSWLRLFSCLDLCQLCGEKQVNCFCQKCFTDSFYSTDFVCCLCVCLCARVLSNVNFYLESLLEGHL